MTGVGRPGQPAGGNELVGGQEETGHSELGDTPSHKATLEPLAVWRASVTACHDEVCICLVDGTKTNA